MCTVICRFFNFEYIERVKYVAVYLKKNIYTYKVYGIESCKRN